MAAIETKRLLLRPFCLEDSSSMFTNFHSDPELMHALQEEPFRNEKQSEAWIKARLVHYGSPHFYDWAVILKENGEAVGECNAAYDAKSRSADIGYALGSEFWHRGYGTEAVHAMVQFLMKNHVHMICGCAECGNRASIAILKSLGMHPIAAIPEQFRSIEQQDNLCCYAMDFKGASF